MKTIVVSLMALALAGSVFAQGSNRPAEGATIPRKPAKIELPAADGEFLRDGYLDTARSSAIAEAAREHLKDGDVKDLAKRVANDAKDFNKRIQRLAERRNVVLPPLPGRLAGDWKSGVAGSDAAYVDELAGQQRRILNRYEKAARSEDSEIAEEAREALPKVRKNFDEALRLQRRYIDGARRG